MSTKDSKKWKSALLKTSLPLEHLVIEKLKYLGYTGPGEFRYIRPNEHGVATEFSADILASKFLFKRNRKMWADLNLLVECKYCHPSVRWLFAPHPESNTEFAPHVSVIKIFDHLCTRSVFDRRPMWRFSSSLSACIKGIEIHNNDATAQNIERGRSQLVFGMPRLAARLTAFQSSLRDDEDILVEFICPVLVTTADLYVLKEGLALDDFVNAESLDSIANPTHALILTNPHSELLTDYASQVLNELHDKNLEIDKRLGQLTTIDLKTRPDDIAHIPRRNSFDHAIHDSSEDILVVNYHSLESTIKKIRASIAKTGRSLKQVAFLQYDQTEKEARIEEYKQTVPYERTGR